MKVLAAELSIQPHLEINYLQQSSLIVFIIVTAAMVTVTMIAIVCSKCNSADSSSDLARTI